jgi:hypothetical protein
MPPKAKNAVKAKPKRSKVLGSGMDNRVTSPVLKRCDKSQA